MKVLSENELLTERGERVHTGDSDELTKRFAESFTKHFDKLSDQVPDLRRAAEYLRLCRSSRRSFTATICRDRWTGT